MKRILIENAVIVNEGRKVPGNDPFAVPVLSWRNAANTLYGNWLNFYVYQETPYILGEDA